MANRGKKRTRESSTGVRDDVSGGNGGNGGRDAQAQVQSGNSKLNVQISTATETNTTTNKMSNRRKKKKEGNNIQTHGLFMSKSNPEPEALEAKVTSSTNTPAPKRRKLASVESSNKKSDHHLQKGQHQEQKDDKNQPQAMSTMKTPKQKKRRKDVKDETMKSELKERHQQNVVRKEDASEKDVLHSVSDIQFSHEAIIRHISIFQSTTTSSSSRVTNVTKAQDAKVDSDDDMDSVEIPSDPGKNNETCNFEKSKGSGLMDSINYLIGFLESSPATSSADNIDLIITKEDVATLLLPWSVARLMRMTSGTANTTDHEVVWRALSGCLHVLSSQSLKSNPSSSSSSILELQGKTIESNAPNLTVASATATTSSAAEGALSTALPQSTLNRLVPLAARVSFGIPFHTSGENSQNKNTIISIPVKDDSTSSEQSHASNCFLHLVRRFRPSLDVACKSLLRDVDDMIMTASAKSSLLTTGPTKIATEATTRVTASPKASHNCFKIQLPIHQCRVVHAILELIHNLMANANPKRCFGILSSVEVLPCLGRLRMILSSTSLGGRDVMGQGEDIGNDEAGGDGGYDCCAAGSSHGGSENSRSDKVVEAQSSIGQKQNIDSDKSQQSFSAKSKVNQERSTIDALVQKIIWDGLFHPLHHMDGYRTMSELQAVPSLPKIPPGEDENYADKVSEKAQSESKTSEGNEASSEKSRKKEGKTCYQAGLFASLQEIMSASTVENALDETYNRNKANAIATANILPAIVHGFFKQVNDSAKQIMAKKQQQSGGTGAFGSSNGKFSSSTTESDAKLQFRFWCHALLPLLESLFASYRIQLESLHEKNAPQNENLVLSLLVASSETLDMVLKYDAYLPSYSDPSESHFSFLDRIAAGLIRCIDIEHRCRKLEPGTLQYSALNDQVSKAYVTSFHRLMLLNHRLLHQRLPKALYFACTGLPSLQSHSGEMAKKSEAVSFLSSVVKTYRELRQIGHFLSSARVACEIPIKSGINMTPMERILSSGEIVESLSLAYQSCPSGQVNEIWVFFDGWIVDVVGKSLMGEKHDTSQSEISGLDFAVKMFILFIKSIRANKHNSPELISLCEKSMTESVSKLLERSNLSSSVSNDSCMLRKDHCTCLGLDLCGWLVEIHNHCNFWVDSVNLDMLGSSFLLNQENENHVLSYLKEVAKSTVNSEIFKKWKTHWIASFWDTGPTDRKLESFYDVGVPLSLRAALQRLALHRIHQLHSMIYYCKLQENFQMDGLVENCSQESKALTEEAEILVDFSIYMACSEIPSLRNHLPTAINSFSDTRSESQSLWAPIAQHLSIWTHYSDPLHAEIFLIWFFDTMSQNNGPFKQISPHEKTMTLALVRDTSFYEVDAIMSALMQVGMKCALCYFINFLERNDIDHNNIRCLRTNLGKESSDFSSLCTGLDILIDSNETNHVHFNNYIDEHLGAASTILSLLASLPVNILVNSTINVELLDKAVGIDIIASKILRRIGGSHKAKDAFIKTCSSCRQIESCILSKILLPSGSYGNRLETATIQLLSWHTDFPFDETFLFSACDAVSELFAMCVHHFESDSTLLKRFFEIMNISLVESRNKPFCRYVLIRAVIRRMNILVSHHSLSSSNSQADGTYDSCLEVVVRVKDSIWQEIIVYISNVYFTEETHTKKEYFEGSHALLLATDVLTFLGNYFARLQVEKTMESDPVATHKDQVRQVFELARRSNQTEELAEASSYFLSSMVSVPELFLEYMGQCEVVEKILKLMKESFYRNRDTPLLDAGLCSLIRILDQKNIALIISHSIMEAGGNKLRGKALAIKIFHMLITCAKGQSQLKYISSQCRKFLLMAVSLLRDSSCVASNVSLFSKMTNTLISKKELLLLSGREIATVCCEMSCLLHCNTFGKLHCKNVVESVEIFKVICSVVASFIVHYPKQLYGCPPPLFGLMLSLLKHALDCNLKEGLHVKSLEYAKLCELLVPHKDIFKKHVIGLILCYIQALNEGLNPTTKTKLMPSIYALLDMCSDFETRQINAMIDVPSKTLFAPVFQSYQKFYQYHGQA